MKPISNRLLAARHFLAIKGCTTRNSLSTNNLFELNLHTAQPTNTCSKLTIETLEQGVKYRYVSEICCRIKVAAVKS